MKLSDYVWDRIAAEGVEDVFMLPGGGCMHLVDSLGRHPKLKFICNLHEQGTAIAVDAYAQVRGFGAGLVTTGPGGTNALTGVAAAWLDSTPCIFISGQVKRADLKRDSGLRQRGFQEIDIVAMARPVTKYAVTVEDPDTIRFHLERAVHLARTGRPGPVWIDIPLDVQAAEIEPAELAGWVPEPDHGVDLSEAVRKTLDLLGRAERPAILAGNGVRLAGAIATLVALAEKLGLPLLTTWKAADFLPEDHPNSVGRPGAIGQRAANFTQQNADWLLVVGARLDLGQIAYMQVHFARGARKIVVDIDPAELAKLDMGIDVALQADAGDFLRTLLVEAKVHPQPSRSAWWDRIRDWRHRYPVVQPSYWDAKGHVDAYVLMDVISELLRDGDVLAPGSSGQCSELTCQALRLPKGVRMINSQGLGPMGFGIPAALGACVASGGRRTICVDGDGGFQMNIQELEVIRRLDLPVKFFVLNNQGYGSIRNSQRNYFQGRLVASDAMSGLTLPNPRALAEAYGIAAARLDSHDQIRGKVAELLTAPGPLVCEVYLDPDQATLPRVTSYQKPDGSMATMPMEDMFPLLDREEFRANMAGDNSHGKRD
jgi:acetolactate synthase-1/2/3 large subunit